VVEIVNERDAYEYRLERICKDCDDHEERIRKIEANDKAYEKLYATADKLNIKVEAVESKLEIKLDSCDKQTDLRLQAIEKWMDVRQHELIDEKNRQRDNKSDIYAIIAMIMSGVSITILIIKFILDNKAI
jgi:hypothetical protein